MPSQIPAAAVAEIQSTVGVIKSATVFINGEAARLQTAVDAALANGATAEELQPVQAEIDALKTERDNLSAAIAANP